ncbi:MAG: thymidylate synthase [Pseudomonadota bacterium]|nr:thymidylate synthase [Pseudomonadota bacterium]
MRNYLEYLRQVRDEGMPKTDRTGTGTYSLFGQQMRFDLRKGFPILTTKYISFKTVASELLWFLSGSTNNHDLWKMNGCPIDKAGKARPTIWEEWALPDGNLGAIYGKQWRHFGGQPSDDGIPGHWKGGIDQIALVLDMLKYKPDSRRIMISAWSPEDLPDESDSPQENVLKGRAALAWCHTSVQFYVADGRLSCLLYARSQDSFLGTPYNISSYSLLTHMLAQQSGLEVGDFIWTGGDCHIYMNHLEQVNLQLNREPLPLPELVVKRKPDSILDYRLDDFELVGYRYYPSISAPVAV